MNIKRIIKEAIDNFVSYEYYINRILDEMDMYLDKERINDNKYLVKYIIFVYKELTKRYIQILDPEIEEKVQNHIMKEVIKRYGIIKEEKDELKWIKKIKPSLKVIEDEILKNSYLEIDNEKWVIPRFEKVIYSIRRTEEEKYYKDNFGITEYEDIAKIRNGVIGRVNKMKKNYDFAFEHRLPYFDYPLSLYDLELAIKEEDDEF